MKKVLLLAILLMISFVYAGDGTGVDPILEEAGLDKPVEWDSWDRQQKWDFLQSNGIYPPEGQTKYMGEAMIITSDSSEETTDGETLIEEESNIRNILIPTVILLITGILIFLRSKKK